MKANIQGRHRSYADAVIVCSFSYSSGQPPTPTGTPTSATFEQSFFSTPKAESSFYDPRVTWDTADPYALSPQFFKTPKEASLRTPVRHPSTASGLKRQLSGKDLEAEISSHVHHLSPNPNLSLPPVEPSRQLSSSPNPSSAKRSCLDAAERVTPNPKPGLALDTDSAMRSAGSMQTPPPTSTSASRRRAQQAHVAKLVNESVVTGARRMSSPGLAVVHNVDTSTGMVDASPQQFPCLQFSPDVFGFPMPGPATAPICPQQKLFWDPEPNTDAMSVEFAAFPSDNFGLNHQTSLDPFVSAQQQTQMSHAPGSSYNAFASSISNAINQQGATSFTMTMAPSPQAQRPLQTPSAAARKSIDRATFSGYAVNPSLLFSSPTRQLEMPQAAASSQDDRNADTLRPYAHQIQESRREREMRSGRMQRPPRGPEADSPAVKAALKALREEGAVGPGLRRSVTDTALTRLSVSSHQSTHQSTQIVSQGHRDVEHKPGLPSKNERSRPDKTHMTSDLTSRKRTAVTFSIDANGRARTETRTIVEGPGTRQDGNVQMELDSASQDSDSEDSLEEEKRATAMNHDQSHNALPLQGPRQPRLGRFSTDSRTHSQKSSYASTLASAVDAGSLRGIHISKERGASNPKSTSLDQHNKQRYRVTGALSSSTLSDHGDGSVENQESEAETVLESDEGNGDAQYELKKVLQDRAKRKVTGQLPRSGLGSVRRMQHSVYPPLRAQTHCYSRNGVATPSAAQPHNVHGNNLNSSPNTITDPDLATPSTDRDSQFSGSTRCVCHSADSDGQLMILW